MTEAGVGVVPSVSVSGDIKAEAEIVDSEIKELEQEMEFMEAETHSVKTLGEAEKEKEKEKGEEFGESDKRSVYVGNVDYGATPEELQEHFKSCGPINRITIMVDKFTCTPKGFAYMEFVDEECVKNACLLHDSLFRGRQLKVVAKRTNIQGFTKKGKDGKGKKGAVPWKGKGKGKYQPYPYWKGKGKGKYSPY